MPAASASCSALYPLASARTPSSCAACSLLPSTVWSLNPRMLEVTWLGWLG